MHHPIKLTSSLICSMAFLMLASGCGESAAEKAAREKERQRIEAEKQAMREVQQANKAITENNKKLGRPPPSLDIGLPKDTKTQDSAAATAPK